MSGSYTFNQGPETKEARCQVSIMEVLTKACPNATNKDRQVCDKVYREILVANANGILAVQVSPKDFATALNLANNGLPLKHALVRSLTIKVCDAQCRHIISKFIEQAMNEASGNNMSGIYTFNQGSKSKKTLRPTSIQEVLAHACPNATNKELQVCCKIYREILAANKDGFLVVHVTTKDFIKALTLADNGLPLKHALVRSLTIKVCDAQYCEVISKFIEQAMNETAGNNMNQPFKHAAEVAYNMNQPLKQAAEVAYNLGYPIHYLFDNKGFCAVVAVFDHMHPEDNISLSVEVDFDGMMSVTAKKYRFNNEHGGWLMETSKNFFEKFEHPHVTVNGDACHTHYSHLADIAKWAERQVFNAMVVQCQVSILEELKSACPNAKEQDLRGCDMLFRSIHFVASLGYLRFGVDDRNFITTLGYCWGKLAWPLDKTLRQILVGYNYNPQERAILDKLIELAMH